MKFLVVVTFEVLYCPSVVKRKYGFDVWNCPELKEICSISLAAFGWMPCYYLGLEDACASTDYCLSESKNMGLTLVEIIPRSLQDLLRSSQDPTVNPIRILQDLKYDSFRSYKILNRILQDPNQDLGQDPANVAGSWTGSYVRFCRILRILAKLLDRILLNV